MFKFNQSCNWIIVIWIQVTLETHKPSLKLRGSTHKATNKRKKLFDFHNHHGVCCSKMLTKEDREYVRRLLNVRMLNFSFSFL